AITSISNFINDVFYTDPNALQQFSNVYYNSWDIDNPTAWNFFFEDKRATFFFTNEWRYYKGQYAITNAEPSYLVSTFFHPYVKQFVAKLNTWGIDRFLNLSTQRQGDVFSFSS